MQTIFQGQSNWQGPAMLVWYLPFPNMVDFQFEPITAATEFQVGRIGVKAIQTPGHTLESTSYLVDHKVLITGDTLFINSVGRPDLKANTEEAMSKSKLLYQSLQKLLAFDGRHYSITGTYK